MRFALLGDPVEHSRSPAIQQAALDHVGIPGTYEALRVDRAGLEAAVADLRTGALSGANVTMPHKRAAAILADDLSEDAARAGAVNTLSLQGSAVVGSLTDVDGIRTAWRWAALPDDGPVLVLGSGGAAAAALIAVEGKELLISARRPERVAALLKRTRVGAAAVPWWSGVEGAVVVNATPLGMAGDELPAPVLAGAAGLFDMAYGTGQTPAVAACRAAGVPVAEGLDMLLAQAMASFSIWTGRPAPEVAMRAALLS